MTWLREKAALLAGPAPDNAVFSAFSSALRHSGKEPLAPGRDELAAAAAAVPGWDPSDWTRDQAARIYLLLAPAAARSGHLLDELYQTADVGEAVALQKALPLLPEPQAHMGRAREGIRSNIKSVFEAVALRNPYPAKHFDEIGWNQLVVKAIFVESPLASISGLDRRHNAALARMLADFAQERWAAGRPFPPELWRCVGPQADARGLEGLRRAYAGGSPAEKRAAALALAACPDPAARDILASDPPLAAAVRGGSLTWENFNGD